MAKLESETKFLLDGLNRTIDRTSLFISISGDRTEQTKEGRKKRQMEEDVFEASESSDSDLEISEGLHRDFEKSSQWGKSLQMLKKMGWKEGEGLGRKQKGMVQQPDLQDIQLVFNFSARVALYCIVRSF